MVWKAEHREHPEFLATSVALESSLLLGPQDWSFYNDSCSTGTYTTRLLMTGCKDDEFTCSTGSCVGMDARLDGKVDCTLYTVLYCIINGRKDPQQTTVLYCTLL